MKNELYELYQQCFPTSKVKKESFLEEIDYENSNIIMTQENCHMIGAAVVNKNEILLLCVTPKKQKKGYGEELLKRCEEAIANEDFEEVIIRNMNPILLQDNESDWQDFFLSYGYQRKQDSLNVWGIKTITNL